MIEGLLALLVFCVLVFIAVEVALRLGGLV